MVYAWMHKLTQRVVEHRRILLLDLVWTLAVRQGGNRRNYAEVIASTETYRLALLQRIRAKDFFVVMLTARSTRYEDVTLTNIKRHAAGWQPDVAIFNEDETEPPVWKSTALHKYVFPEFGPLRSQYFALEANRLTRRMYSAEGIVVQTWENFLSGDDQLTMNW
jgi:hypothetical protein